MAMLIALLLFPSIGFPILWLAQRGRFYRPRRSFPGFRGSRRFVFLATLPFVGFAILFLFQLPVGKAVGAGIASGVLLLPLYFRSRLQQRTGVFVSIDAVEMLRAKNLLGQEVVRMALAGSGSRKGGTTSAAFALLDDGYAFFWESDGREKRRVRRHFHDLRAFGAISPFHVVTRFAEGEEDVISFHVPAYLSSATLLRAVLEGLDDYIEGPGPIGA
ncbi:hypothetical protein [Oleomonas cavernae]|nr:hypothetical protein [Oleomonas cavernae]